MHAVERNNSIRFNSIPPQAAALRAGQPDVRQLQHDLATTREQVLSYSQQCQALGSRVSELSALDLDHQQRISDLSRDLSAARAAQNAISKANPANSGARLAFRRFAACAMVVG